MLCSWLALRRRRLQANDSAPGEIDDLPFDDRDWAVRHAVVDTGRWLPGRKVLIPPASMGRPRAKNDGIPVELTKKQIKDSPPIKSDDEGWIRRTASRWRCISRRNSRSL